MPEFLTYGLYLAAKSESTCESNLDFINFCLDSGADPHTPFEGVKTAWDWVLENEKVKKSLLFLNHEKFILPKDFINDIYFEVCRGHTLVVRSILEKAEKDKKAYDLNNARCSHTGNFAIHEAVLAKDENMVSLLLQHGADPHCPNFSGESAWKLALNRQPLLALNMLKHSEFVLPEIFQEYIYRKAYQNDLEFVRALLEKAKAGDRENGLNTFIQATKNRSLHYAVKNHNVEMVKLLLAYGADRELTNNDGKSAVFLAYELGKAEVLAVLFDKPHYLTNQFIHALHSKFRHYNKECPYQEKWYFLADEYAKLSSNNDALAVKILNLFALAFPGFVRPSGTVKEVAQYLVREIDCYLGFVAENLEVLAKCEEKLVEYKRVVAELQETTFETLETPQPYTLYPVEVGSSEFENPSPLFLPNDFYGPDNVSDQALPAAAEQSEQSIMDLSPDELTKQFQPIKKPSSLFALFKSDPKPVSQTPADRCLVDLRFNNN